MVVFLLNAWHAHCFPVNRKDFFLAYNSSHFADIGAFGLPAGALVMDLGSQDVQIGTTAELDQLNAFIKQNPLHLQLPASLEARAIFERAGYRYWCVDVDNRPETIYVDLNQYVFPPEFKNRMDFVANCGTTEHLANPISALALMHSMAKKGGILFHDVPVRGYDNHALVNLTPRFWDLMIAVNSYDVLTAEIRTCSENDLDRCFVHGAYESYIKGSDISHSHAMIRLVLRKTTENVFIPPYDVDVSVFDFSSDAKIIKGALYPFMKTGAMSEEEIDQTIKNVVRSPQNKIVNIIKNKLFGKAVVK